MKTCNPILLAKGITRSYRTGDEVIQPLRCIDLAVNPGEFVAIMGASGSGKSTLLHILGCLERPDHGTYLFDGQDVSTLDDVQLSLLRATRIGFIFQAYNLIPQFTLLDNVAMPFAYRPSPPDGLDRIAARSLEVVGLGHRLNHRPNQLSGGEMQRAAIARALVINPLLILADEPTGNLDENNTHAIMVLFSALHQKGTTLLVVTHDQNVARSAGRILYFRDGRIHEHE